MKLEEKLAHPVFLVDICIHRLHYFAKLRPDAPGHSFPESLYVALIMHFISRSLLSQIENNTVNYNWDERAWTLIVEDVLGEVRKYSYSKNDRLARSQGELSARNKHWGTPVRVP